MNFAETLPLFRCGFNTKLENEQNSQRWWNYLDVTFYLELPSSGFQIWVTSAGTNAKILVN